MIDFRYLEAFLAVAQTGSFTNAGKKLHIATSAISRQIQILEANSKCQLFFRSPREAKLTPKGERLFEKVKHFQIEANQVLNTNMINLLRIGTLQGVLQKWFSRIIIQNDFFRNSNLEIRVDMPQALITGVEMGNLDVAFISSVHRINIPKSLKIYRLFKEKIVLISTTPVNMQELHNLTWICLTSNTWLFRYCKNSPTHFIIVNDVNTLVSFVQNGLGIAMVPYYFISEIKGLCIKEIDNFSGEHICMLTRKYESEPDFLKKILTAVRRELLKMTA